MFPRIIAVVIGILIALSFANPAQAFVPVQLLQADERRR